MADDGTTGKKTGKKARRSRTSRTRAAAGSPEGKRYYRIGEVSKLTGVKPYVLRYWEGEFRWMAPTKSRSKQRLYRQRDIEIIQLIRRLLWEEKFTIAGARKKLQEIGVGKALDTSQLEMALDADPRSQLRRIRESLQELRATLA